MKVIKEWNIKSPWGNIALISWGNPKGSPILLVHGREDSAATFIPLLETLPGDYHYVGVDLPGHGKSEPFPTGVMLSRFHYMLTVEYAIEHLRWKRFMYMAHSMGCECGLFYNAIYPGRITKIIHLDPTPAITRMFTKEFPLLYQGYYETFYENYNAYRKEFRTYTKEQAMRAVMKARAMNEEQAELILSRNMQPIEDGLYRLSWNKVLKIAAPWNFTDNYYYELFTESAPPTLVVSATHIMGVRTHELIRAHKFIDRLKKKIPNFYHIIVEGGHDLHFLNPESISQQVTLFMRSDFRNKIRKSKL